MRDPFTKFQPRVRELILRVLLVVAVALPTAAALPAKGLQGPPATLVLEAPAHVELGDRIEIQLIVDRAQDLAGYETQLLFDTTAAHFSGFHQRDSDLKKFGRDVIPLEEGELPDGVTLGLASCPYENCVELKGNAHAKGANGRVRLGSVFIGTDQEGRLELRFDHLKFVDSNGNVIPVEIPQAALSVQVGAENGVTFAAPASTWQWTATTPNAANFDVTGDAVVNYADAAEVAVEWKMSREQGQPCGLANDLSRDTNGDGCIDVSDIQFVLANAVGNSQQPRSTKTGPNVGSNTSPTMATASEAVDAAGGIFTVNSTFDTADATIGDGICATSEGDCTLRAAIAEANSHTGPDTIQFNISGGGLQTIQLTSRLPSLFDNSGGTTIDGYSQPGAQPNTDSLVSNAVILVQVRGNGPSAFDVIQITSANNRIQGLAIFNSRRSLWFYGSGAQNNVVTGNFIGTNAAGTFGLTVHYLYAYGVEFENGASNNQVGGTSPADRNVISGNARTGIDFNSDTTDNNVVYNNLVGLNPSGTARLMNLRHGVDMNSGPSYNVIGGTDPGQRNILSGNGEDQNAVFVAGVEISHDTLTSFNSVIGNCVGTDPSCNAGSSTWSGNRHYGINLEDGANNNTIAYNVIGNNPQGGIRMTGSGSNRNQIHDNRIGLSLNNTAIPNGNFGIQVARAAKFITVGPNNIITNTGRGVNVLDAGTDGIKITQNSIFNGSSLGIDLGPTTEVNQNDSGDTDSDANEGLNWPVLTSATPTQVTGTACADSIVPSPCRIEVFIAERRTNDKGAGNYGQGKTFVGAGNTNSSGSFAIAISGVTQGQYLTATAIDAAGNTSEFSQNIQVGAGGGGTTTYAEDHFARTVVDGWGSAATGGSYSLSGTAANFDVDGSAGTMVVPAAGGALSAKLSGIAALDVDFLFRVKTDKLAAGSNQCAFFIARSISSSSEYRGQLRIASNNMVYIRATKAVNGSHIMLGTEFAVPGLTYSPGTYIWMRGEVVGTNPTTIRLKAWADGQVEPSNWQFTVTDSEPSLQTSGSVGLRSFLASGVTNAPVVFTFDDLVVTPP